MDAPPVNRLLQLLRQKPSEPSEPPHSRQTRISPSESVPQSISQSNILSATKSDTLKAYKSNTLSATESDTQAVHDSSTLSVTQEGVPLAVTGLSKGQQRVLRFLLSNRDASNYSRTIPIGYDAISRNCFLHDLEG